MTNRERTRSLPCGCRVSDVEVVRMCKEAERLLGQSMRSERAADDYARHLGASE